MATTTDKLKSGTSVLNDAHARLEETVGVGEGIMGELHRNRETMLRTRANVGVVSGTMDEARRILRSECGGAVVRGLSGARQWARRTAGRTPWTSATPVVPQRHGGHYLLVSMLLGGQHPRSGTVVRPNIPVVFSH
jgi:hypothetical protein